MNNTYQTPVLKYSLTPKQLQVSNELIAKLQTNSQVLIKAVCGAGKTEIVTTLIANILNTKQRVGFVIPRRDLVVEIGHRLQQIFPTCSVQQVYGGHTKDLDGDIIVCTAHQAYRYNKAFGLTIIDEIDAFPYKGNEMLKNIVMKTSTSKVVLMSATPSDSEVEEYEIVTMNRRFHNIAIPVPKIVVDGRIFIYIRLIYRLYKYQKIGAPVFIYVPRIEDGHRLYRHLIKRFKVVFVYSSMSNRQATIEQIRQGQYKVVITTTILERGVTFANLQVIVYNADHHVFSKEVLVQIIGRVGRSIDYPNGDVLFLSRKKSTAMVAAKEEIKKSNVV